MEKEVSYFLFLDFKSSVAQLSSQTFSLQFML